MDYRESCIICREEDVVNLHKNVQATGILDSQRSAEPSSEVEVVQLLSLNDHGVAFNASNSSHNSTGNKTNASGPSQSCYVNFEQLITESNILSFKLAQAQPSQQTPMPRSEISGNDQDTTYLEEETLRLCGEDMSSHVPIQFCQKIWDHQYCAVIKRQY